VTVEDITLSDPKLAYPRFIDGARRAPPEDVGGEPGFEHFLIVMADPSHPEHADIKRWYGANFDPTDISETKIAARLAKIANRKPETKLPATKSKRQIN
jgi:Plasmid pRiA4b ORF-3-like protein